MTRVIILHKMVMQNPPPQARHRILTITVIIIIVAASIGGIYLFFHIGTSSQPTDPHLEWQLLINGSVETPLSFNLSEIMAMPKSTVNSELLCLPNVGSSGILMESGSWTGVKLQHLLELAGVKAEAVKVAFHATDDFTTDLTIDAANQEDVLVAYEKNGSPLQETLRLVAPNLWGYKWIKWLTRIEVVNYDFKGFYESRGFPDDAKIT